MIQLAHQINMNTNQMTWSDKFDLKQNPAPYIVQDLEATAEIRISEFQFHQIILE